MRNGKNRKNVRNEENKIYRLPAFTINDAIIDMRHQCFKCTLKVVHATKLFSARQRLENRVGNKHNKIELDIHYALNWCCNEYRMRPNRTSELNILYFFPLPQTWKTIQFNETMQNALIPRHATPHHIASKLEYH